jgi:hypothetical protein
MVDQGYGIYRYEASQVSESCEIGKMIKYDMSELFQTMFNDVFFIPDKHTFWEDK